MPFHPKFSPHQFRVSSGLQVPDLPFVRDRSFSLSPTLLGLARSFHCLSPAVLVRPRTWSRPSVHPPFRFPSVSHGLSLACTTASCYSHFLGCPLALLPFTSSYSFCSSTALVKSSSPPPPHLGLMCSLLAGLPGSGSFLIRRSYQPPLGPLLCCSPAKPSLFPCSPSADGPAAEKTGACAHLPALAGCYSLRAHAFSLSPLHLYSGCRPPLLRRPCSALLPSLPKMNFASTGSFPPAYQ